MRDIDTIDSETGLAADLRRAARERGGPLPSIDAAAKPRVLTPAGSVCREPLGLGCAQGYDGRVTRHLPVARGFRVRDAGLKADLLTEGAVELETRWRNGLVLGSLDGVNRLHTDHQNRIQPCQPAAA
jgi:hypothetical protein